MGKRIAIIGAGAGGLAAAKAIASEPHASQVFSTVDVIERAEGPGGLWNYKPVKKYVTPKIPSPTNENSGEIISEETNNIDERIVTPMYENLETNIPKDMMAFRGLPFPDSCELFPTRDEVAQYVRGYAATIPKGLVNFVYRANVVSAKKVGQDWEVTWEILGKDDKVTKHYDDLILAQGHFDTPFIPDVPGLSDWYQKDPKSITHAKYFKNVEPFKDKKVLIVGNSASGIDIATQSITYTKSVTMSSTSESPFSKVIIDDVAQVGRVAKYDYEDDRSVTTEDGHKVSGIDLVIFCTGYLYKIPFLKSYQDGDHPLLSDGSCLENLYRQIFYIQDPSLSLMLVPQLIVPFPCAECQAQYIARILSGRLKLPSEEKMYESYHAELKLRGEGRKYHALKGLDDCAYYNELCNALGGTQFQGFVAEYWDDKRVERRSKCVPLKSDRLQLIVRYANQLKKNKKPFKVLRGKFE